MANTLIQLEPRGGIHKVPHSGNRVTLNSLCPLPLGNTPGFLYLSGYERVSMKKRRLGEVLRERGHLSTTDLNQILLEQRGKPIHLGELLLQSNKVAKIDLVSALTEVSDIPYLDCTRIQVDPAALKLIPQSMARHCNALPVAIQDSNLTVVITEPQNLQFLDELRFKSGKRGPVAIAACGGVGSRERMKSNNHQPKWDRERLSPRIHTLKEISVHYEGGTEEVAIRPPDVSTHGMFFNRPTKFPEGTVLNLRFRLALTGAEIRARCEVRYCLPGIGVGVEFSRHFARGGPQNRAQVQLCKRPRLRR